MNDSMLRSAHEPWEQATADGALRDEAEPALHLIEPRGVGGRAVQVQSRLTGQPCFHVGMLVRRVVVQHEMNVKPRRDAGVDVLEEAEELLMPTLALGEDLATLNVDRGE